MIQETVRLREHYPSLPETGTDVVLKSYARSRDTSPRTEPRAAVLVLHGGGYFMKSVTEYEPVALRFMAEGMQAFTLDYSLLPAKFPQQLWEAAAAIDHIRRNAEKYMIDPNAIAVCGFSAGAHLSALLSSLWQDERVIKMAGLEPDMVRPNGMILSYPPTDALMADCMEMFSNLMGGSDNPEILKKISPLHLAGKKLPPAFIWHTFDDEMVSVQHSFSYAAALKENGIPLEMHIFPHGPHAMALCDEETAFTPAHYQPHAAQWFELAVKWLKLTFNK